jgi:oligoribonuclease
MSAPDKNAPARWLFLDLETTGLDPKSDFPLEIAAALCDPKDLDRPIFQVCSVIAFEPHVFKHRLDDNPVVLDMHTKNGLLERLKDPTGTSSVQEVDKFLSWLLSNAGAFPIVLAGNSVHFDRGFLKEWFPKTEALLHYRHLDVSVFKVMAKEWAPELVVKGTNAHRALPDVLESIAELKRWRDTMGHAWNPTWTGAWKNLRREPDPATFPPGQGERG